LGIALWVFAAPVAVSGATEGVRTTRTAKFVRPATVPVPPDNAFSPEMAELGRITGAAARDPARVIPAR